jgi:hypothetical protein
MRRGPRGLPAGGLSRQSGPLRGHRLRDDRRGKTDQPSDAGPGRGGCLGRLMGATAAGAWEIDAFARSGDVLGLSRIRNAITDFDTWHDLGLGDRAAPGIKQPALNLSGARGAAVLPVRYRAKGTRPRLVSVAVAPVQGPLLGGLGVAEPGDGEPCPFWAGVLTPGWPALDDRQLPGPMSHSTRKSRCRPAVIRVVSAFQNRMSNGGGGRPSR